MHPKAFSMKTVAGSLVPVLVTVALMLFTNDSHALLAILSGVLVLTCCLLAVAIQSAPARIRGALGLLLPPPTSALHKHLAQIKHWSVLSRKQGLGALGSVVVTPENQILEIGLSLLVSGAEPQVIYRRLGEQSAVMAEHDAHTRDVFAWMAHASVKIALLVSLFTALLCSQRHALAQPCFLPAVVPLLLGGFWAFVCLEPGHERLKSRAHTNHAERETLIAAVVAIAEGRPVE